MFQCSIVLYATKRNAHAHAFRQRLGGLLAADSRTANLKLRMQAQMDLRSVVRVNVPIEYGGRPLLAALEQLDRCVRQCLEECPEMKLGQTRPDPWVHDPCLTK